MRRLRQCPQCTIRLVVVVWLWPTNCWPANKHVALFTNNKCQSITYIPFVYRLVDSSTLSDKKMCQLLTQDCAEKHLILNIYIDCVFECSTDVRWGGAERVIAMSKWVNWAIEHEWVINIYFWNKQQQTNNKFVQPSFAVCMQAIWAKKKTVAIHSFVGSNAKRNFKCEQQQRNCQQQQQLTSLMARPDNDEIAI